MLKGGQPNIRQEIMCKLFLRKCIEAVEVASNNHLGHLFIKAWIKVYFGSLN